MVNWQLPLVQRQTGRPARWLGTIRRNDGLNFVVATMQDDGQELVGAFTVEGQKASGSGIWDIVNA